MNVVQKSLALLGTDRRRLPAIVFLFLVISAVDVLGIGLMGPFMSLVLDASLQARLAQSLGDILNTGIDEKAVVMLVGFSLMAFFFIRFFLAIAINAAVISFTERQRLRLKVRLLKTYQSMSSQASTKRNTAEYIQAVHTLTGYYTANVLFFILKFASETIICVSIIVLLAFQNLVVILGLISLLLVVTIGWDKFSKTQLKFLGRSINEHSSEALRFLRESLDGYEEIRVLGKTGAFIKRFEKNAVELSKLQKKAAVYSSVPRYLLEFAILLFVVSLGTFSFVYTSDFATFVPVLTVFAVATVRLMPSASLLSNAIVCIRHNSDSVSILYEDYLQSSPSSYEAVDKNATAVFGKFEKLEIKNLSYSFDSHSPEILQNIDLKINAGDSIGIVGQSGSGKTSLANLILGLLNPVKGSILVNGISISLCKESWQSHLAVIPQEIFLLDASIATNVSLEFDVTKINTDKLEAALGMASITDFVTSLPSGVMTEIGEKGAFLSGGQRQRLILARAFYHERDFLIMDEATSALDFETEAKIVDTIIELKKRVTTVVITHRLSTVEHCDHIFKIENGKITQYQI